MELLVGAIVSFLAQGVKKLAEKYGRELTKQALLVGVFILAVLFTVLTKTQLLGAETVKFIVTIFSASIATYEIIIKRLYPIILKALGKEVVDN